MNGLTCEMRGTGNIAIIQFLDANPLSVEGDAESMYHAFMLMHQLGFVALVFVDMEGAEHINLQLLAVIAAFWKVLTMTVGTVVLCNVGGQTKEMLSHTTLPRVFGTAVYDSVDLAVAQLVK